METYQTAKFDRSPNNLSWNIVLTDRCREKKKRIRKAQTIDLHLHADLIYDSWWSERGWYHFVQTAIIPHAVVSTIIFSLCQRPSTYMGLSSVGNSNRGHFEPLGGKVFGRYSKEEERHDWPNLYEVTASLTKGHRMTKGGLASEWNRLCCSFVVRSRYSKLDLPYCVICNIKIHTHIYIYT